MSMIEVESKVRELRELRRLADDLAGEISAAEDMLKAYMTESETDTIMTNDAKVTWKAVTSSRLDTTALKKALPEVAERFMKTATARRFVVA